ncbi:hypothetical protein PV05_03448 [Exophiala xenobiotica]|uniref:Uncharacterized protein n=1 Tax=Exophiala xenobiotica TaxID=348802 RepID=A0A0D2ETC4_9EURO|nr:uncharacterized protein PV05_03448 [Exophiala xenobiotica]KIW58958.1 hypothetical protein PV05_03448 [Exophiala xenobiotica]
MGTGQRFHLPGSLKRAKSNALYQEWKPDRKEHKAQNVLGISEAALNTARNESVSSSNTARIPALSFSDATTELGSSRAPTEKPDTAPELRLKASSVLLHEDFCISAETAKSIHSKRLKSQTSSSTLGSHYDPQRMPLAISQQTSDSSRRDFALRKGSPVIVKATTPEKDSLRQLRVFRSSKNRDKVETKKLSKIKSDSSASPARTLFSSQRYTTSTDHAGKSVSAPSSKSSVSYSEGQHPGDSRSGFMGKVPVADAKTSKAFRTSADAPVDAPHIKLNIRRPRVGAKHWFDGLEGDSSEEESVHEPEFQPSFVAGMESAFEDGRIGPVSKGLERMSAFISEISHGDTASAMSKPSSSSSRHVLPASAIPPRVSTLNAKSSKVTLSQHEPQPQPVNSVKPKSKFLASSDLHTTSILDLSSSDDEEQQQRGINPHRGSLPQLRDSIAVESLMESDIVVETAKAIDTKQNASIQATPSVRRVARNASKRGARPSIKPPNRTHDSRQTYFSDHSSAPEPEESDLLTSFPPTPTESRRTSLRSSCLSDNASIESRRMVSVTKQEESLLAVMRLKKAALQHGQRSTDPRIRVLRDLDRKPHDRHLPAAATSENFSRARPRNQEILGSDSNSDQASCTTFQTGRSIDPSNRFSMASFRTETSLDPDTDMSFMPSPSLLPVTKGATRLSRATFFSTSTGDSRETSRSRREHNYRAALERLSSVPPRDDIPSQEFIDWPYHGWDVKTALATAR